MAGKKPLSQYKIKTIYAGKHLYPYPLVIKIYLY